MKKNYMTPITKEIRVNIATRLMQSSISDTDMKGGFSTKLTVGDEETEEADARGKRRGMWDDEEYDSWDGY